VSGDRRVWAVGAVAVVGAAAVAFVLLGRDAGSGGQSEGLRVQSTLVPQVVLFGDTLRAVVDVTLDSDRVDPGTVRLVPDFAPWKIVGEPVETWREAAGRTHIRHEFVLRCLTSPCIFSGRSAPTQFEPVQLSFGERQTMEIGWPELMVYSRSTAAGIDPLEGAEQWRADLLSLPGVSYRIAPGTLLALLVLAAVLLGGAGIALAFAAWPRRAPAPPPEPEVEEVVFEPALSPLEQALLLLEESVRDDGPADQRRALELVAEELELADWGDPELGKTARVLAWSEDVPHVSATSDLAARVRSAIDERTEQNGNGRVG
jgi:hypothetical protein